MGQNSSPAAKTLDATSKSCTSKSSLGGSDPKANTANKIDFFLTQNIVFSVNITERPT